MSIAYHALLDPGGQLAFALAAFLVMVGEWMLSEHPERTHDLRESAASLGVAVGQTLVRIAEAGLIAIPFGYVYAHRLFDFDPLTPIAIFGLFVGTEFFYYWHHRASHRIRWMWATHAVHHSPTRLNTTAAVRLGWTNNLSGTFVFYLPLAWFGYPPLAVAAMLGANLAYQFFIHTELVGRLGVLEYVLNTPSHHRVHHASNPSCLDRNYGGVTIVFDRLFGTFAEAPPEPLAYGLVGVPPTLNPFRIVFQEWVAMLRDLRSAPTLAGKWRALAMPPGWREPSNPGETHEAFTVRLAAGRYPLRDRARR